MRCDSSAATGELEGPTAPAAAGGVREAARHPPARGGPPTREGPQEPWALPCPPRCAFRTQRVLASPAPRLADVRVFETRDATGGAKAVTLRGPEPWALGRPRAEGLLWSPGGGCHALPGTGSPPAGPAGAVFPQCRASGQRRTGPGWEPRCPTHAGGRGGPCSLWGFPGEAREAKPAPLLVPLGSRTPGCPPATRQAHLRVPAAAFRSPVWGAGAPLGWPGSGVGLGPPRLLPGPPQRQRPLQGSGSSRISVPPPPGVLGALLQRTPSVLGAQPHPASRGLPGC